MSSVDRRDALPIHGVSAEISTVIRLCGLVDRPLTLDATDLARLPLVTVVDDFTCLGGWSVPTLEWTGPTLAAIVGLGRPHPEATFVTVGSSDFATSIPLKDALGGAGLLALRLGGEPLPAAHGGPCRLVLPGRECFTSIKWVDRIELTAAPKSSGEKIALARLDSGQDSDDTQ